MVGHSVSDSLSLVTHKAPPWLEASREILIISPVQILGDCYLTLLQKFISGSVAPSNWWLWIWIHGKMCTKNIAQSWLPLQCSSLQQELKCLCLQCRWKLVCNNWIGHMLEVIIMQLTWTRLIAPDVLPIRNSKISLVFKLKTVF